MITIHTYITTVHLPANVMVGRR